MSVVCVLPKITPRSTPLTQSASVPSSPKKEKVISAHQMMIPKAYEVYPSRLASAPDIPKRPINVLSPNPPTKRTPYLETAESHWFNEKRSNRMKQREHYRYHNAWSKYYYGSAADKESHRVHQILAVYSHLFIIFQQGFYIHYTRSVLKQQMSDKEQKLRDDHFEKVKESVIVSERDNEDKRFDADKFRAKFEVLKSYRDENKKLMEVQWDSRRHGKMKEDHYDREQMRYNPINWSCSLK